MRLFSPIMLDAIIIISFILAGAGTGFHGIEALPGSVLQQVSNPDALRWICAGFGGIFGLAIGLIAQSGFRRIERQIRQLPAYTLLSRSVGLVIGLLVANLLLAPTFLLPIPPEFSFIKPLIAVVGSIMFSVSGMSLADVHGRSLLRLINPSSAETLLLSEGTIKPATSKVLDTSCIIDGRFADLLDTGFLEGQLLVPQFVLHELQQVADASNDQKRVRGRRGLDILNRVREDYADRVIIHPADYEDVQTVDAKLVRLAQEINATLLTTDYNLNKVATVQKVPVLNVNDLTQAIRPSYLPGDSLDLKILREGKEPAQGIGYLNDGTMVVVEDGRSYVGGELQVVVTSSLQTSAGRMIFAKPKTSAVA